MEGELVKLMIVAYSDPEYNNQVEDGEFTTLVNPESYTFKYKIELEEEQAPGTSAAALKFNKIAPQELDFDFLFDRTGAIPGADSSADIIDDIEKLKAVTMKFEGDQHKPNYLRISWGSLLFKGCLTDLSINFKLFKPDGSPIRALAKGTFKGFVEDNLRVARENAQSPDLTHVRAIRPGDTLALLCHQVYGDYSHYLEIARVNKLVNFRKLIPGQELVFPPVKKATV